MKTKILLEFETFGQTAQMTYKNISVLAETAPIEVRTKETKKIRADDIEWCDIVISVRGMCSLTTYISELCKEYKRIHIYTLDDNLFILSRKDSFMVKRQKELQKTLDNTCILWTPNQLLAEYVCGRSNVNRYACTGWIIHDGDINGIPELNNETFKIVYYSNDGSSAYFWGILEAVLPEIRRYINKAISIEAIGMHGDENSIEGCSIKYVPHLSLVDFRKYLANGEFDVGLAPLIIDDGFSKYKYANKFFEFSMAGIPGIYSNCPPNTFVVKDRINGFLVRNTSEEWLNAIKEVAENPSLRRSCILNAQEQLRNEYYEGAVFKSLIEQIPELLSYHAPKVKISSVTLAKVKYLLFRTFEKMSSFFLALKKGGVKEAIKKTKRFIHSMMDMNKEYQERKSNNQYDK